MEVRLFPDPSLPAGQMLLPPGSGLSLTAYRLRLGRLDAHGSPFPGQPAHSGQMRLAPDLWERLAVPFPGIRLTLRSCQAGEIELGPAVVVLYPGEDRLAPAEVQERLALYYGDRYDTPGLMAIGFDQAIDWERGVMAGYVLDTRPGRQGQAVKAQFPLPAVVRLTWSIRRKVIDRLRKWNGDRTFNWVRNIGKWQFHRILSELPSVAPHLPDTRLLRGRVDLAAMLARHRTAFVKDVFSIKGCGVARVRLDGDGLDVSPATGEASRHSDLDGALNALRLVLGEGRQVIQRGIAITGREGRALDFRVVLVRDGLYRWRCPVITARVAPDRHLAFTNVAHGAEEVEALGAIYCHLGISGYAARACMEAMVALCTEAADGLARRYNPLGILGFDVAVESGTHKLWLLEANSVPGWDYGDAVDQVLARSQTDYAFALAGLSDGDRYGPGARPEPDGEAIAW